MAEKVRCTLCSYNEDHLADALRDGLIQRLSLEEVENHTDSDDNECEGTLTYVPDDIDDTRWAAAQIMRHNLLAAMREQTLEFLRDTEDWYDFVDITNLTLDTLVMHVGQFITKTGPYAP